MTKEDIAREFKKMIKEAADKKARKIISVKVKLNIQCLNA